MEVLFKEIYRFDTSATFRSGFSINGGEPGKMYNVKLMH